LVFGTDNCINAIPAPKNGRATATVISLNIIIINFNKISFPRLLWLPGVLQSVANAWINNPTASLISGDCIRIGPQNEYLTCHVVPRQMQWFSKRGLIYIDQPGTFWRKDLFNTDKILDMTLHTAMDHDLWYRITLQYKNAFRVNRCLAAFRLHESSKTANIQELFIKETDRLREKYSDGRKQISFLTLWFYRFLKQSK